MVLGTDPAFVMDPVALISLTSPSTKPSPPTVTSGLVRAVPSYGLLADSDVRVTGLLVTSRVPLASVLMFLNWFVTSLPSFRTLNVSTSLSAVPTSVMDPFVVTSYVKPSGTPVTVASFLVRASPSYGLLPFAGTTTISSSF